MVIEDEVRARLAVELYGLITSELVWYDISLTSSSLGCCWL